MRSAAACRRARPYAGAGQTGAGMGRARAGESEKREMQLGQTIVGRDTDTGNFPRAGGG